MTHRDDEGCDALFRAALGGHEKCVQILLDCVLESFEPNKVRNRVGISLRYFHIYNMINFPFHIIFRFSLRIHILRIYYVI